MSNWRPVGQMCYVQATPIGSAKAKNVVILHDTLHDAIEFDTHALVERLYLGQLARS